MPKKSTKPKGVNVWVIISPKGEPVGFGRMWKSAWLDVDPKISHYPVSGKKPDGYQAVKFKFPFLK